MDRDIDVRTPESVAFRYELAGLGSRFVAVFIDLAIQIVLLLLVFWGLAFAASKAPRPLPVSVQQDSWATSIAIAFIVATIFLIFYGYFILFEIFWNGQTPGKKLLGIRVVRDGGYPVDFGASFLRNVIRIAEQLLGFYMVAAIVSLISQENKRIGDYAAGTIVVREAKYVPAKAFLRDARTESATASSIVLSPQERALIRDFLERRTGIAWNRREEIAARLAALVRPRVPPELAHLDDEGLLERL